MRGEKVYSATWRKGIQVVDINQLKTGFVPCCTGAHFSMRSDLNLDGGSFNTGAVLATIAVDDSLAPNVKPWMRDLSLIDVGGDPIIAVASSIGLVLASEAQSRVVYQAQPSHGGKTMKYVYAVETALLR